MIIDILLFALGIALAVVGANFLVEGASNIAAKFRVPPLIIGMTIVAFGTSLPEFVVNLFASINHQTDLAVSNILGSNIFNLLLIIGVCALVKPLTINIAVRRRDVPMNFLAAFMIAICGFKVLLDGFPTNELVLSDGIVFLSLFLIFLYYTFSGIKENLSEEDTSQPSQSIKIGKTVLYIIGGLIGLIVGGEMLVDGAKDFAQHSGMSSHLIGLLIVGPGTSIPELVTSIIAVRKGRVDIAVGNIIGSNIFNVFFTLGISACIYKLPLPAGIESAVIFHFFIALLLLLIVLLSKKFRISRIEGGIFITLYLAYVVYITMQG